MPDNAKILKEALVSRYEAQYKEATAILSVYYSNAVGIGEHAQIIDEMAKLVEKAANAKDCLGILSQK